MLFEIRDVTDLAGCRAVVDVQDEVWGRDSEVVPASLLLASIKRGGILVGAWHETQLVGFVWSMPGVRQGMLTHWSHMLGVRPEARGHGLGVRLKNAQCERALTAGVDLIEWTFDPLQAPNAHLNLSVLGCWASEYRVNAYGEMTGPLHRGTPTDRLVAEWWIRREPPPPLPYVPRTLMTISTREEGEWLVCDRPRTDFQEVYVLVPVPPRFSDMQRQATEVALAWRLATREVFSSYFTRGYRAVGFQRDRKTGGGAYVLWEAGLPVVWARAQ